MRAAKYLKRKDLRNEYKALQAFANTLTLKDYPLASETTLQKNMILIHYGVVYRIVKVNRVTIVIRPLLKHYVNCKRNQDYSYKHDPDQRVYICDLNRYYVIPFATVVRMIWLQKRFDAIKRALHV